jgi:RimJ/RimL family protein N-acetyltransferase
MPITLPIETERVVIREFVREDRDAMLTVYGDPEVMRYIPGGVLDAAGVEAVIEGQLAAQAARGFGYWALLERESGAVIGDVGFGIFELTRDLEVGYTLARSAWGRGYATESAGACLEVGLAQLNVARIVAVVDRANAASIRVAERLGMRKADELEAHGRPHVLFEILRP